MILGALCYATMWMAIFEDVGVMVLAVLNALRALSVYKGGVVLLETPRPAATVNSLASA